MSVKFPVTTTAATLPLREAALAAIAYMRTALEDGLWTPSEMRDPDYRPDTIEAQAETDIPVFDLAICRDLADISLGAIDAGEWQDVDEEVIMALQRFNFLIQMAEELAPDPEFSALEFEG